MTALPATAEEQELQQQVAKALESQGVLGKIKAQLRAAVFEAIHGSGSGTGIRTNVVGSRPSHSSVLPSVAMLRLLGSDGHVALELVRNLLECLELEYSLSVFVAETGMDSMTKTTDESQWRLPSRLCERVRVSAADERTPVLVKMLRVDELTTKYRVSATSSVSQASAMQAAPTLGQPAQDSVAEHRFHPEILSSTQNVKRTVPALHHEDLPPPPPSSFTVTESVVNKNNGDDDELNASVADEIASGSFEEESLAESASLRHSQSDDVHARIVASHANAPSKSLGQHRLNDEEEGEENNEPPLSIAIPPPVPAKLGPLPWIPGRGVVQTKPTLNQSDEAVMSQAPQKLENEDEDENDEELDDHEAVARLRSLEEKLKEMEAQDDTGYLQQLKHTTLHGVDDHESTVHQPETSSGQAGSRKERDDDDDDDNYGSDFEEEVEDEDEDEDEDIASELSEDITSVSVLSESEEQAYPPAKGKHLDPLENDKAVESEDALNSYDYIEAVEKQ